MTKAIAMIPPMGREKHRSHPEDEKPKGRNELIAEYLHDVLGDSFVQLVNKDTGKKKQPRKVVSSHIQVLKQKFTVKKWDASRKAYYEPLPETKFG